MVIPVLAHITMVSDSGDDISEQSLADWQHTLTSLENEPEPKEVTRPTSVARIEWDASSKAKAQELFAKGMAGVCTRQQAISDLTEWLQEHGYASRWQVTGNQLRTVSLNTSSY